jgi:hypothetical protein
MSEEHNQLNCPSCGLSFGFPKEVEKLWRESHKQFFCPNGHSMSWTGESPSEKEHRLRKEKVEELETKLAAALKELEAQKKRADELAAELEIWRPTTTETKDGSEQAGTGNRAG